MLQTAGRSLAVAVCALICSMVALLAWRPLSAVRAEDRNRDGRPDLWRSFDGRGQVARVAVDTNFDGRSDVEEFYEAGALVRRQADRDFNDRVDLVQNFDPASRHIVRSLTDVDADGVADLLVLFQEGEPVYAKWAEWLAADSAPQPSAFQIVDGRRVDGDPLAPLTDPFSGDLAIKTNRGLVASPDFTPSAPVGMLEHGQEGSALRRAPHLAVAHVCDLATAHFGTCSPRAPPAPQRFS
jgi:hypothetical protein